MADKTADDLGPEDIGRRVLIDVGKNADGDASIDPDDADELEMIRSVSGVLTTLAKGWERNEAGATVLGMLMVELDGDETIELASDDRVWFT